MTQYDLSLRDYWRILRKRKIIVVFATLLLGFFSFSFAIFQKPIPLYEASSSVKVEESTSLTGLYMEALSWSARDTLETQAAIIKSYPVMEKVAKRLGFLDKDLTYDEIRRKREHLNTILDINDRVSTKLEGYTNIITITATSENPELAQELANTIAEVYREENIKEKNRRVREARVFIEQQLKITKENLKEAEENLKEYREKNKFISIDSETGIILGQLTKTEAEYGTLEQTIEEIDLILKNLKKEEAIQEKDIKGIFADKVGPIFARLNSQLVDLNLERDALLLNFTEDHPRVKEIKTRISKTVRNMIAELSAQKKTLEGRKTNLEGDIDRFRKNFGTLPEKGLILSRLEHDLKVKSQIFFLLESKHQEALIKEAERVEEVSIVRPAIEPTSPVNPPHVYTTLFLGVIIGLIIGLIMAFVFETLDTSIGTIEDVEKFLEVPVLGVIPYVGYEEIKDILLKKDPDRKDEDILKRNARLVTHFAPKSTLAESYRTLRTNVQFISVEKGARTLSFTSSSPLEGKTTTVANLATTMAQIGKKTLLVESDLRKPMISRIFGIEREPGLTDVVLGNYEWRDTIRTVADIMTGKMGMEDIMLTPGIDNLNIITCGSIPPNPSEILNSQRITDFISQVREEYDVVLFDSAPALTAADASILGSKVDGVIIVYQVGQIARGALRRTKAQLENVNAKVLGVILNGLKAEVSSDYAEFRYDRYYAYGEEEPPPQMAQRWFTLFGSFMRLFKTGGQKKIREDEVSK
ncbi:MAG: polysaccharide biosynthesis tyrosine autokinase [Desulfobacterales bacterium]|nr:polysaccharide biosynthesis tyrosine autokinase [Desulfobacterales bacterium]